MREIVIIHTEIYMGKRIDVFSNCTVAIDGDMVKWGYGSFKNEDREYRDKAVALSGAKQRIFKNATKYDEIKKLKDEIKRLEEKLKELELRG